MIKKETGYRRSTLDDMEWLFSYDDSLITLLHKIVLSPGHRLLNINTETRELKAIFSIVDVFDFLIATQFEQSPEYNKGVVPVYQQTTVSVNK